MYLNCETILDFYTHKNRKVLCQIKVNPKSSKFRNSCRCLSQEQWLTFDKELARHLSVEEYWNNGKRLKFNINPRIEVKVQKSKLTLKHFYKCLGTTIDLNKGGEKDVIESNLVLECLIDFQLEVPLNSSVLPQEYEPRIENSPGGSLSKPLPYEPYTPSKRHFKANNKDSLKNPSIAFLENNEDAYTPKPIFEIGAIEPLLTEVIPKYTPAPINTRQGSREKNKFSQSGRRHNEVGYEIDAKVSSPDKYKFLETKLNKKTKKMGCEYIPRSREFSVAQVPIYIPTPIEETTRQQFFKADDIKKSRKRSNTIDVFPERHDENAEKKQIQKAAELSSNETLNQCCNKKLKQRSMTIDEIPATLTDVPIYTPTPIEETKLINVLKPKLVDESINEKYISKKEQIYKDLNPDLCKNKKLKNRSSITDEISAVLAEPKAKQILNKFIEKKKEASDAAFVDNSNIFAKAQTIMGDSKFENDNKPLQQLVGNPIAANTFSQKQNNAERKIEGSSALTRKSVRRSKRSPSKPKRLIEERSNIIKNCCKKLKPSPKNKELFGTDDDDDDGDCFENTNNDSNKTETTLETILNRKPDKCNSQSSPGKKERKRHKSREREREKNMTKST